MADDLANFERGSVRLDAQSVERIARRVAELLRSESPSASAWLTAADVAHRYSVSRTWVYENAERLGAVRLGDGSRARIRFEPDRVREHFEAADGSAREQPDRRMRHRWVAEADLSPIRGH